MTSCSAHCFVLSIYLGRAWVHACTHTYTFCWRYPHFYSHKHSSALNMIRSFLIILTQIWWKNLALWLQKANLSKSMKEQNWREELLQDINTWLHGESMQIWDDESWEVLILSEFGITSCPLRTFSTELKHNLPIPLLRLLDLYLIFKLKLSARKLPFSPFREHV